MVYRILNTKGELLGDGVTACVYNVATKTHNSVQYDWILFGKVDKSQKKSFEELGSHIYTIRSRNDNLVKKKIADSRSLFAFLKSHKYSIVHLHTAFPERCWLLIVCMLAGVPVRIIHSHAAMDYNRDNTFRHNLYYAFLKFICRKFSTHRIACSKAASEWMFGNIKDVFILKNGISIPTFKFNPILRDNVRRKHGIDNNCIVIGAVGRLSKQKNIPFLIDVFNLVRLKDRRYLLILVGEGELDKELRDKVEKYGLSDEVIFTGQVNNVAEYMSAFDLFALPSLYEGLPTVGIEAQCSGLPCLFSDRITSETDITKKNKFLPLDTKRWVNELLGTKALNEREQYAQIVTDAGYDINKTSKELLCFYKQAADTINL